MSMYQTCSVCQRIECICGDDCDDYEPEPCPWCGQKWECQPTCPSRYEDGQEPLVDL